MFADAIEMALPYTKYVIFARRQASGQVGCGIATFMVLSRDGWILTAAHVIEEMLKDRDAARKYEEVKKERAEIESARFHPDAAKNAREKHKRLAKLDDSALVSHYYYAWGDPTWQVVESKHVPEADIAVCRLEPFDGSKITNLPVFKDPTQPMRMGTSLCRLGYALNDLSVEFVDDPEHGGGFVIGRDVRRAAFRLPSGAQVSSKSPPNLFPNEGIMARWFGMHDERTGNTVKYIEVSTPGIPGQSGGPILDAQGNVWGVQSHTRAHEMGMNVPVKVGNATIPIPQLHYVGVAAHAETVLQLLQSVGIPYTLSSAVE